MKGKRETLSECNTLYLGEELSSSAFHGVGPQVLCHCRKILNLHARIAIAASIHGKTFRIAEYFE